MLDLMRQANRRKWFVWIVIMFVVLSFVISIFMIWGGAGTTHSGSGSGNWTARVNNIDITPLEVERLRSQVENQYRQILGPQFDAQASGVNFDQIALSQLVRQTLAYTEAVRLGLQPSQTEVAEAIVRAPVFQRNGRFIGRAQYLQELRGRGIDVGAYESDVARELAVDKLRDFLGTMVSVSNADVDKAFADEGQTAEVDYVLFKEADYADAGEPSAKEIQSYFSDHRASYLTQEKRRVTYALIERDPIQGAVEVSDTDMKDYYEKNKETKYKNPEQRRASHILVKVGSDAPSAEVEAARTKAAAALARARGGEDFAKLAAEYSDDSSAQQGGDLGWFGTGRMVPDFEKAAFALSEGQISDLVRTPFGFHVIKLTGSRPPGFTPYEEARDQIRQQLSFGKAQELLTKKADEFSTKLGQQSSSFEGTAREMGMKVSETEFFAKGEPVGDLGPLPQAVEEIFRLKPGEHNGPIPTPRGLAFARLTEIRAPDRAEFDTVKDQVKMDLMRSRTLARARAAAAEIVAAGAEGFKAAADKKKVEVKSTGEFNRASAPAEFNDAVKESIFSHKANDLIGPLETTGGVVIVKMIKRGPETPEDIARVRGSLRNQVISRRKGEAFDALVQRLQRTGSIEYNPEAIEQLQRRASR